MDMHTHSLISHEVDEESCDAGPAYPQYEGQWMSAQLLALAADYIDTLLEDWYPGLGAREGNKTVESVPYVNRVVPCPFCVSSASLLPPTEDSEVCLPACVCVCVPSCVCVCVCIQALLVYDPTYNIICT